jgi:pimeloyl-ACP methyl ester carboxylesterase
VRLLLLSINKAFICFKEIIRQLFRILILKKKSFTMLNLKISCFLIAAVITSTNFSFAQTESAKNSSDSAHYYISTDGIKIYYEVKGKGYPVVLVHGFIVNSQTWKRGALYNDLLAAGYKVILIDLRGNGKSDKPHDCDAFANDAEAKDIMGIVTTLGVKKYTAIGYSRGSIITARLLVLDNRLEKAVMGGMGTDFTNPQWPRRIMFYKALSGEDVPELAGIIKYVNDSHLDKVVLACMQKEQPSTSREALAKVKINVLVICGDKDSDNGNAQELAKLFSASTFAQVTGDHGGAVQTKEFSDTVLHWLQH